MRATGDSHQFSNIAATPAAFYLTGGRYFFSVIGTGFGTVVLQVLGPDGTTWINAGASASFAANGGGVFDLPPGQYQVAITTTTAVYANVTRIPGD